MAEENVEPLDQEIEAPADEAVPEVEPDEPEAEQDTEPEDRPPSRAEARFQKLANERAEERAKRELAEKQAEFYRQQLERQQAQVRQEENLDPDEKWRRDANQAIRQTQLMAQDMADKATFLTKYSRDQDILSMSDQIENKMTELRNQGYTPNRENVLVFLMGQKALENRAKASTIKKDAAARVKAAAGQPLGSKSNVATSKSSPSLEERLRDIPL